MITGTPGNDDLANSALVNNEIVDALEGDDVITIVPPLSFAEPYVLSYVTVHGGEGFDTLVIGNDFFRTYFLGLGSGSINQLNAMTHETANGLITYDGIERLILTGELIGVRDFHTGDTHDTIRFESSNYSGSISTGGGDDSVLLTGTRAWVRIDSGAGDDVVDLSQLVALPRTSFDHEFVVNGGDGNDRLVGTSQLDKLSGAAGDDVLTGGAGDDVLNGGTGRDILEGGDGNDTYYVETGDIVSEATDQGHDRVLASGDFALRPGVEVEVLEGDDLWSTLPLRLTGNEFGNRIVGNGGANTLRGFGGDDYLVGYGGNDWLDGGEGKDELRGGSGNDIYFVDSLDKVYEESWGFDAVYARGSYALLAGQEIEVLATADYRLTDALALTGNEFNNAVTGNNGDNRLRGGGGDDSLRGLDGHDILDGGAGRDLLIGGTGNDVYFVDGLDRIEERVGEGSDAAYAGTSYKLADGAHVEVLATVDYRLTGALDLRGNEFNNAISGNNGANLLWGGGGDDSLRGLDGNDVLDGAAGRDYLVGGGGADVFRFASTVDSAVGAADQIADFLSGVDRIDLSGLDANIDAGGDQAFSWIGAAAFSGTAGELRSEAAGPHVFVYGDTDGDRVADFQIIVELPALTGGDFIL